MRGVLAPAANEITGARGRLNAGNLFAVDVLVDEAGGEEVDGDVTPVYAAQHHRVEWRPDEVGECPEAYVSFG